MRLVLRWCQLILLVAMLLPCSLLLPGSVAAGEAEAKLLLPDLLDEDEESEELAVQVCDPFEGLNRISFVFNDTLYFWVIKPVKQGYTSMIPEDFRKVLGNFFYNLRTPIRLANKILQGHFRETGIIVARFSINTTLGVLGFGDIAAETFDLQRQPADFGQTLGRYGFGEGLYLYWPLLGPSNLRDTVGFLGDSLAHPVPYTNMDALESAAAYSVEFVNKLSITSDVYEEVTQISIDPYIAVRQAYSEYRRAFVENNI